MSDEEDYYNCFDSEDDNFSCDARLTDSNRSIDQPYIHSPPKIQPYMFHKADVISQL
jgi:hypothetical protein